MDLQCIEKVGRDGVTPIQLEQLIHVIDEHLKEHFLRAQQRIEKRKDEDYDEGVEEILEDEVSSFHSVLPHPFLSSLHWIIHSPT